MTEQNTFGPMNGKQKYSVVKKPSKRERFRYFHNIDAVLKELGEDTEEAQSDDSLE